MCKTVSRLFRNAVAEGVFGSVSFEATRISQTRDFKERNPGEAIGPVNPAIAERI